MNGMTDYNILKEVYEMLWRFSSIKEMVFMLGHQKGIIQQNTTFD